MLNKIKAVLRGLILITTHINVEIVFVEAIKDDLDIAWLLLSTTLLWIGEVGREILTLAHDLVDFAVLLATDKLFVFVGQFNFDAHLILASRDEWNLIDNSHGSLDSVIGSIDRECQVVEADLCLGIGTDVGKHRSNVGRRRGSNATLCRIRHNDPPRGAVELASLKDRGQFAFKKHALLM